MSSEQLNHEDYGETSAFFIWSFFCALKSFQRSLALQGLVFAVLATMCVLASGSPAAFFDPISTASFTAAGGLVLTGASGGTATIPTAALVGTKALALKGLALKAYASSRRG